MSESSMDQISGMSMDEVSDIISQMKVLIEQNEEQARQVLLENPVLTKALFKAQTILKMSQHPLSQPMQTSGLPHQPFQLPQPSVPALSTQHHSHMQPSSVMPPPHMRPSLRQFPLPSQSPYQITNSSVGGEFGTQMGGRALSLAAFDQMSSSPIISEVENAFIQQIMNVTPDQLNLLPPEHKNRLMKLKQMLMSRQ